MIPFIYSFIIKEDQLRTVDIQNTEEFSHKELITIGIVGAK